MPARVRIMRRNTRRYDHQSGGDDKTAMIDRIKKKIKAKPKQKRNGRSK